MIKNDRIYIYGENEILNLYKQKWKGRYYKKLHGDKCGWSFPIQFRAVIENLLSSTTNDNTIQSDNNTIQSDNNTIQSDKTIISINSTDSEKSFTTKSSTKSKKSENSTKSKKSTKSENSTKSKKNSEWEIDIPIEIYNFFKKYLS